MTELYGPRLPLCREDARALVAYGRRHTIAECASYFGTSKQSLLREFARLGEYPWKPAPRPCLGHCGREFTPSHWGQRMCVPCAREMGQWK